MPVFTPDVQITNVPDVTVSAGVNINNFPASQTINGSVSVSNFPATQPVSGPLTDAQLRATPVPVSTIVTGASTSTVTQVTSVVGNQTLLAANANRKKAILFFTSGTWNVKLGVTASATSFSYLVSATNFTLEVPSEWRGQIDVFNAQANKLVNVTELV